MNFIRSLVETSGTDGGVRLEVSVIEATIDRASRRVASEQASISTEKS